VLEERKISYFLVGDQKDTDLLEIYATIKIGLTEIEQSAHAGNILGFVLVWNYLCLFLCLCEDGKLLMVYNNIEEICILQCNPV
jgi:hypothetical protein